MKKFKKLFAALMAAAMMMALCVVGASAEDEYVPVSEALTFTELKKLADDGNLYFTYGQDVTSPKEMSVKENANGSLSFSGVINTWSGETKGFTAYTLTQTLAENKANSYEYGTFAQNGKLYTKNVQTTTPTSTEPTSDPTEETKAAVNITKTVDINDNIANGTVPDGTEFKFKVTPVDAANSPALATNNTITINKADFKGGTTATVAIDLSSLESATYGHGVYKYTVEEDTAPTNWENTSTNKKYTLIVNKDNTGAIVNAKLLADGAEATDSNKKDAAEFTNKYTETLSLDIKKEVPEESLVKDDNFEISVKFDQDVTVKVDNENVEFKAGVAKTYPITKDQTISITGIPAGVKYTIEETKDKDAKSTSWKVDEDGTVTTDKPTDKALLKNTTVTITNNFDKSETGLATRIAPFVAMAVLAGGAVAAYFVVARKRQENE